MSEVNPELFEGEQWEGILGETKSVDKRVGSGEHQHVNRKDALKYEHGEDYKVIFARDEAKQKQSNRLKLNPKYERVLKLI